MSNIQLPYGYVKNNKQVQFHLPNNYEESFYLKEVPHLTNQNPAIENNLINLIRNRDDLKKWLIATSKYGDEIQEDLNAIVGHDEKFNNAIVRHALDLKDEAIFRNPNPINVTFHDMKKFDLVNPVIGKLATQVKANKLTDYELTKKILQKGEIDELQLRLDKLKYGTPKDDDDNIESGGGGGSGGTPGPPRPPRTPQQRMDEIRRGLDYFRGNTPDVPRYDTREKNSRIIAQKSNEKFVNQQTKQRQGELLKLPKGIVNKRRSTMNFNFSDKTSLTPQEQEDYCRDVEQNWLETPGSTISGPPQPTSLFNYDRDFPPLSRDTLSKNLPPLPKIPVSRETSFLSEESIWPLKNRLPNIAPLSSRPSVDNFSRPITEITDEKSNNISITPKKKSSSTNRTMAIISTITNIFS